MMQKIPWIDSFLPESASEEAALQYFGTQAVYRVSLGTAVFFLGLSALTVGIKHKSDVRDRAVHHGSWAIKTFAYLLCLVGAFTSAFGSSAGLLGVLIPLAVPFLVQGEVGVTGMIIALSISATVVDSTPFSSVGALTLATAPEQERRPLFRTMLGWGAAMVVTAPVITWLLFVLPTS